MPTEPQDHRSKTPKVEEYFTFTSGGQSYTMPRKTEEVINTRFVRRNRRRDETDFVFTALEQLAGEDEDEEPAKSIIEALEATSRDEFQRVLKEFKNHMGATLGE